MATRTDLVLSSRNAGKIREMTQLLGDLGVEVSSSQDHRVPEVEETGTTLAANALLKAAAAFETTGKMSLGDDTGLFVDALDGAPGIYAARYAGPDATYEDNNEKLLRELTGVAEESRTAAFVCHLTLLIPPSLILHADVLDTIGGCLHSTGAYQVDVVGRLEGTITAAMSGQDGFGYDPVFFHPASQRTLAEMTMDEKNAVSHRSQALKALRSLLEKVFQSAR